MRLEDNTIVAAASEEDIYRALELDYIAPELRENCGEIEAAAAHTLPQLITLADIRGDLHMHTDATDGRDTIRQMADAALARGLTYIAITDHSKNLAMTNGLDDTRALAHVKRIREVDAEMGGRIRVLPGIEVDILADGSLDLEDSTLAQMDVVVASVHSHFNQTVEEMTARVVRALENPHVRILGHPTGRKILSREPYAIDIERVLQRAADLGVAVEHTSESGPFGPERPAPQAGQRTGLQDRGGHGRPLDRGAGPDPVWDHPASPGVAHCRGRTEYPADG